MNDYFDYMLYLVPVIFIALSCMYKLKYNKLQGTGKIPKIIGAYQRQTIFLVLAIVSALIIILNTQSDFFLADEYRPL